MFKHQYKERTYAEEILKNGFTSKHIKHELKLLVKYYKEQGFKPKERKELTYEFCEKYLEGFDRVTHFKLINSVLNHGTGKKNILVEIDCVPVTNRELDYISGIEVPHDYKKIIFALLVLDKLNKKFHELRKESVSKEHYFGGAKNYKELISTSKVSLKKNSLIHKIIGELNEKGIVEIVGNGSIKLSFMYEIPKDDNVILEVKTYDNIGYYYDLCTGENKVKKCECCNVPIKISNNKNKYCNDCAKEKERIRKREWKQNNSR